MLRTRVSVERPVTRPSCDVPGCCSKGVMELSGVPKFKDQPQAVASLVLKAPATLSVAGGSRLLAGARFVMKKPVDAVARAGANSNGRVNQVARIKPIVY